MPYPVVGIKGQGEVLDTFLRAEHNSDGSHSVLGGTMQATNKSGGSVVSGDLGWMDYGDDSSFVTSTTQNKTDSIPVIARASIANNNTGTVAFAMLGGVTDVNFTGTPTIGQYVRQSTSAKLCEGVTTMTGGCFAKVALVTGQFDIVPLSLSEYLANTTDIIKEAAIDWANAGGLTQIQLNEETLTTTSASFEQLRNCRVYIPSNANSLEYMMRMKHTGGTVNGRLATSTNDGSTLSETSATFDWATGVGTLDISDKSGWTEIDIDLNNGGSGTGSISLCVVRII